MAPTSKSGTSKSRSDNNPQQQQSSKSSHHHHRHSKAKSQDSDQDQDKNPVGSPTTGKSRRSGGGRTSKGKEKESIGKRRHDEKRRSSLKSSLQETLSSYGDDANKKRRIKGYDNHGYFHSDLPFNISKEKDDDDGPSSSSNSTAAPYGDIPSGPLEGGGVENELASIMSKHDSNLQQSKADEGARGSKWKKMLAASVTSNRFHKLRKQDNKSGLRKRSEANHYLSQFYDSTGTISFDPPFWGVSRTTRGKFSFLSLSLILHELACFTSCVLLGCMIFQGMEAISWVQQRPFTDNWIFFKWHSSFQTILVVITCLGFLNRVDTTEQRSLWLLPLFLTPVLCLSVSDYCNKAWELQRLECHNFYKLDATSKLKVHLTQDCSSVFSVLDAMNATGQPSSKSGAAAHMKAPTHGLILFSSELEARGTATFVMRILSAISTLVISSYLFCCRKNHYLVNTFGPPKEFVGSIDSVLDFTKDEKWESTTRKSKTILGEGDEEDEDGMNVIYQRA